MQWFRMYSEFAGDPVIQTLAFEDQRHYVVVLCLKSDGVLDRDLPTTRREAIICRGLGLDPATASEVKRRLMEVNLVNENWQPSAWNKRQFVSDDVTKRTRKHRNNKKVGNVPGTIRKRSGNGPDTDTETDTDTDIQGATAPARTNGAKFHYPTEDEVSRYCAERKNGVDPAKWHSYYSANGWKVGKNPMKDWKAAVRTWEEKKRTQEFNPWESP